MASKRARIQIIASRAGVAPRARAIWARHPVLKQLTAAAVAHFDPIPLGIGSEDLVHCAVRNAVRAFDAAKRLPQGASAPAPAHYIAQLLLVLSSALLVRVQIGAVAWDPAAQSWSEFSTMHPVNALGEVRVEARFKRPTRKAMEDAFRRVCAQLSIESEEVIPLVRFDGSAGVGLGGGEHANH